MHVDFTFPFLPLFRPFEKLEGTCYSGVILFLIDLQANSGTTSNPWYGPSDIC